MYNQDSDAASIRRIDDKQHLPVMTDQLVTLMLDPTSDTKTTLDILEEVISEEY